MLLMTIVQPPDSRCQIFCMYTQLHRIMSLAGLLNPPIINELWTGEGRAND